MNDFRHSLFFCIKSLTISGGAERVFVDIVNGLTARGINVAVVTFDKRDATAFYPLSDGVDWIRLGIGNARQAARPIETLKRVLALRRILKLSPKAVYVAFMHSAYLPAGVASIGTNATIVGSEHIVPQHYESDFMQRAYLRLAPSIVDVFTGVSQSVRSLFPEPLRSQMVVVPNPISLDVDGRADPIGTAPGSKTLLSVGRLSKQKDYATLVDAFAIVAARYPDWNLRIVGDGPMRRSLEQQIQRHGLATRICLVGTTTNVGREYRAAQVFVLPSLYESQGLSAVEAIAHGLPVVAFEGCSGLSDFLVDGVNSVLVHGKDRIEALASVLDSLMKDGRMRASLVAPNSIDLRANDLEAVLDQWVELLNQYAPKTAS